jgi:uncharacterized tellurite resistance protein B-like protein
MSDERLGLDDLTDEEKLAFGALLRAMVSLDGTYSGEEKAMFKVLADDLGDEAFWAMLERASKEVKDAGQLLALADEVTRPQARELLFYGVNATAQAGGVAEPEGQLLDELRAKWGLERDASDSA